MSEKLKQNQEEKVIDEEELELLEKKAKAYDESQAQSGQSEKDLELEPIEAPPQKKVAPIDDYECDSCGFKFVGEKEKCPSCGVELDFSEEKEE